MKLNETIFFGQSCSREAKGKGSRNKKGCSGQVGRGEGGRAQIKKTLSQSGGKFEEKEGVELNRKPITLTPPSQSPQSSFAETPCSFFSFSPSPPSPD